MRLTMPADPHTMQAVERGTTESILTGVQIDSAMPWAPRDSADADTCVHAAGTTVVFRAVETWGSQGCAWFASLEGPTSIPTSDPAILVGPQATSPRNPDARPVPAHAIGA